MADVKLYPNGVGDPNDPNQICSKAIMAAVESLGSIMGFDHAFSGTITAFCNLAIKHDAVDEAIRVLHLAIANLPLAAKNAKLALGPVAGRA